MVSLSCSWNEPLSRHLKRALFAFQRILPIYKRVQYRVLLIVNKCAQSRIPFFTCLSEYPSLNFCHASGTVLVRQLLLPPAPCQCSYSCAICKVLGTEWTAFFNENRSSIFPQECLNRKKSAAENTEMEHPVLCHLKSGLP